MGGLDYLDRPTPDPVVETVAHLRRPFEHGRTIAPVRPLSGCIYSASWNGTYESAACSAAAGNAIHAGSVEGLGAAMTN
jgi:hypothetical protein